MTDISLRRFTAADAATLVDILVLNGQYDYPEVEGPTAMLRVADCRAAYFAVAESQGEICGFVRGVFDGSRALIHLLSVHPRFKRRGVGHTLVDEVVREFKARGAPTVAVLATDRSRGFWEREGFSGLPIHFMLRVL